MGGDKGITVEARLPVSPRSLLRAAMKVEEALRLCEMVGSVKPAGRGRFKVVFLPRHMGLRIPHSYLFEKRPLDNGVLLEGRALFRRLSIRIEAAGGDGEWVLLKVSALCQGPEVIRRIARKEVHRFLGQLADALFRLARVIEEGQHSGGSVRSPPLTTR